MKLDLGVMVVAEITKVPLAMIHPLHFQQQKRLMLLEGMEAKDGRTEMVEGTEEH